jgi:hypothetical protein
VAAVVEAALVVAVVAVSALQRSSLAVLALRFQPLKELLAAFLERAKGLVQGALNRFRRCYGVASKLGLLNHLTLAGDALLEHTDLLIGLGEKVACVLHRHRFPAPVLFRLRASRRVRPGSSF